MADLINMRVRSENIVKILLANAKIPYFRIKSNFLSSWYLGKVSSGSIQVINKGLFIVECRKLIHLMDEMQA